MISVEILDAAMGTEIISSGINLPKYTWSADTNINNPDLISEIHKKNIQSGADYITTNTFRSTPRSFRKTGLDNRDATKFAYQSFLNAIAAAKKAKKNTHAKIIGSVAPLEDCYKPSKFPGLEIAEKEYTEISKWFKNAGINTIILETMNNIPEIITCLKVFFDSEIWLSLNLKDESHILSGDSISNLVKSIDGYRVSNLMINCNSIKKTSLALNNIASCWNGKWGIYPNIGLGEPSADGIISSFSSMSEFINVSQKAVELGATILGGCCGSNYKHTKALYKKFC